jgi:hypothetical protein
MRQEDLIHALRVVYSAQELSETAIGKNSFMANELEWLYVTLSNELED